MKAQKTMTKAREEALAKFKQRNAEKHPWEQRVQNLLRRERERCADVCRDMQAEYLDRHEVVKAAVMWRAKGRILGTTE